MLAPTGTPAHVLDAEKHRAGSRKGRPQGDRRTLHGSPTHPECISNIRMPSAHQSTALPWPLLWMTSGARYSGVPQRVHVLGTEERRHRRVSCARRTHASQEDRVGTMASAVTRTTPRIPAEMPALRTRLVPFQTLNRLNGSENTPSVGRPPTEAVASSLSLKTQRRLSSCFPRK